MTAAKAPSEREQIERAIRSVTVQNRFNPDKVLDAQIEKLRARLRYLEQHPDEEVRP